MQKTIVIIRILGLCIFAAAFFLPGCTPSRSVFQSGPLAGWSPDFFHAQGAGSTDFFMGWECARFALTVPYSGKNFSSIGSSMPAVLLLLSGWVNLIVLAYLVFCLFPKRVNVRRVLSLAVPICLIATWIYFFLTPIFPLLGHYLWAAGALGIAFSETMRR
jgi:hypothetical protein